MNPVSCRQAPAPAVMPHSPIFTGYSIYYKNVCYKYLELNKTNKIRDIEETTFENFENAKYIVQNEGRDTPAQRLKETKMQSNYDKIGAWRR